MGRPALRIEVTAKDRKELAKLLGGGVQQVLLLHHDLKPWPEKDVVERRDTGMELRMKEPHEKGLAIRSARVLRWALPGVQ